MSETPEKQVNNRNEKGLFKKGFSGNLAGRPKGKTLKEFTRDYLAAMTEEERFDYLDGLPKEVIWKMSEGNPKNENELSGNLTIAQILKEIENEDVKGQSVENSTSLQDQEQVQAISEVQAEQSPDTL